MEGCRENPGVQAACRENAFLFMREGEPLFMETPLTQALSIVGRLKPSFPSIAASPLPHKEREAARHVSVP